MCKRHRDGYKTRELNSDSMYKKRLLCFEESARLRECEVQCFTRGGFFYLFFSFAKKAHHARKKEDGHYHHQSLRRDEEGPKGQKGKKKGKVQKNDTTREPS